MVWTLTKIFFQAISVASVISDRICIHSDGKVQPKISARNLLACDQVSYGCRGGVIPHAFSYWIQNGLVTGGPYESDIVRIQYTQCVLMNLTVVSFFSYNVF